MDAASLAELRQRIDGGLASFDQQFGEPIKNVLDTINSFLNWCDGVLIGTPWPVVLIVLAALVWVVARSWGITLTAVVALALIGYFGMWEDAMKTIALTIVSAVLTVLVGFPIGLAMAWSNRLRSLLTPVVNVMLAIPGFVYLLPVVMLAGAGRVPAMLAIAIYAIPPVIRFTNLGLRQVDGHVLEAADAFGSTRWQRFRNVQVPLALPTIATGINQAVMMVLAMIVVASIIGVDGLGEPILKAIGGNDIPTGMLSGLAIIALALVLDKASRAYSRRREIDPETLNG